MLGKIFLVAVLLPQCTMERVVIDATDAATMRSSIGAAGGSVAKFRWPRENGLNTSGTGHVRVQMASF
jgi:hypothetical protein